MGFYKVVKTIYSGAISKVCSVDIENKGYILKKYYKKSTYEFEREVEILEKLKSKHIIEGKFHGKTRSIVLEKHGTSLSSIDLRGNLDGVEVFKQIVQGLEYIHSKNIVHFDLKPANILLEFRNGISVKIIDFASSKYIKEEITTFNHTPAFCSLEYLLGYRQAEAFKDIWSLGCILYNIITGIQVIKTNTSSCAVKSILDIFGTPKLDWFNRNSDVFCLCGYSVENRINVMRNSVSSLAPTIRSTILNILLGCLDLNFEARVDCKRILEFLN